MSVTRLRRSEPCASRKTTPALAATPSPSKVMPEMSTVIGTAGVPTAVTMLPDG